VDETDFEHTLESLLATHRTPITTIEAIEAANVRLLEYRSLPRLLMLIEDTDKILRKYGVPTPAIETQP
jgi:hypothetical protein